MKFQYNPNSIAVPMHDIQFMYVFDPCDYFLKESTCFSLLDSCMRNDIIKQLSTIGIFHHQEQLLWGFNYLNKLRKLVDAANSINNVVLLHKVV